VETALLLGQVSRSPPILVLEKLHELPLILRIAERLNIRPTLGIRAKLATRPPGHWGASSGDQAKFGLSVRDVWHAVEALRAAGRLDCVRMLHFHIGSQVSERASGLLEPLAPEVRV